MSCRFLQRLEAEQGAYASSTAQEAVDEPAADLLAQTEDYMIFNDDPIIVQSLPDIEDPSTPQPIPSVRNPLEAILPRHQICQFVQLFFDYIYCLTPCVHPPSIWRDLRAKREEREGEDEWTHMILSLIASTLAQLPKALNTMPNEQCVSIIASCWTSVSRYLRKDAEESTVDRSESFPFF